LKYRLTSEQAKELLFDYSTIEGIFPNKKPDRVEIWDETLRDGEQSPGVYLTQEEKIKIAKALEDIGVSIIAVGFPAVSSNELRIVKSIVKEGFTKSSIVAIARPRESDINACLQTDVKEIVLFMPISKLMMEILKLTPQQECEIIGKMIDYARDHGLHVNWLVKIRQEHSLTIF
jgi:isopropylmalate/homocitrate/citramalate synthase